MRELVFARKQMELSIEKENDTYIEQRGTLRESLSLDAAFGVVFVILLEAVEVRVRLQHAHLRVSI